MTGIPSTSVFPVPSPRVKAIEYNPDGTVKRVEYFDMPDAWLWGPSVPQIPTRTQSYTFIDCSSTNAA